MIMPKIFDLPLTRLKEKGEWGEAILLIESFHRYN